MPNSLLMVEEARTRPEHKSEYSDIATPRKSLPRAGYGGVYWGQVKATEMSHRHPMPYSAYRPLKNLRMSWDLIE